MTQQSDADMPQHLAQITTNVHQIIPASEMFVNRIVTATKTVWPTNDVYEERVDQFATAMQHVEVDKYVKIDYVKLVVEMI